MWLAKRPGDFGPIEREYVEASLSQRGGAGVARGGRADRRDRPRPGRRHHLRGLAAGSGPADHRLADPGPYGVVSKGDDLVRRGDLAGALAAYTSAMERTASDPSLYLKRGNVLLQNGDAARALADFDAAIRLDGANPRAYHNRAAARAAAGQRQGAIDDYGEAIRLDPTFGDAYLNRASLYEAAGERRPRSVISRRGQGEQRSPAADRGLGALAAAGCEARHHCKGAPPPPKIETIVTIYVAEKSDMATAEYVAEALRGAARHRRRNLGPKARTSGDVRFLASDEQAARDVATVVEDAIARRGYALPLRLITLDPRNSRAPSAGGSRSGSHPSDNRAARP